MQLLIAVGVALAWGLVGGVIDAAFLGGVEFASTSVAISYSAASALFSAAACLPVALGLWSWVRLTHTGGRTGPDALATYEVTGELPEDLTGRTHFFWMSRLVRTLIHIWRLMKAKSISAMRQRFQRSVKSSCFT